MLCTTFLLLKRAASELLMILTMFPKSTNTICFSANWLSTRSTTYWLKTNSGANQLFGCQFTLSVDFIRFCRHDEIVLMQALHRVGPPLYCHLSPLQDD